MEFNGNSRNSHQQSAEISRSVIIMLSFTQKRGESPPPPPLSATMSLLPEGGCKLQQHSKQDLLVSLPPSSLPLPSSLSSNCSTPLPQHFPKKGEEIFGGSCNNLDRTLRPAAVSYKSGCQGGETAGGRKEKGGES